MATAAAAIAVGGCGGSDEDDVRATVEGYLHALGDGDYAEACDKLGPGARRDLARYPQLGTDCEEILARALEAVGSGEGDPVLKGAEVSSVRVSGDEATAEVKGATQTAHLERAGGEWEFSSLEFPGPP